MGQHFSEATETDTICLGRLDEAAVAVTMDEKHSIQRYPALGCERASQRGALLLGPVFQHCYVCRSCSCNALNALAIRHGAKQPGVTEVLPHLPDLNSRVQMAYMALESTYYDSWLAKWPAAKQAAILQSIKFDPDVPRRVKSFVKREGGHGPPKKARLIQGYHTLATQELYAREFSTFQKALADVLGLDGFEFYPGIHGTMCSGYSGQQIGDWLTAAENSTADAHFYERDGKNWDATMQRPHHDFKVGVMRACSSQLAAFADECYSVVGSVGSGSNRITYKLEGTVKSGHNDTTSGNSLINAAITARAMHLCGLKGRFIVAGDDMLAVISGDFDAGLMLEAERRLGIVPEARKFYAAEDVSFISGIFLRDALTQRLGFFPSLGRTLARLWWTTRDVAPKNRRNHCYSVACGLWDAVGALPCYGAFLQPHIARGGRIIETGKGRHSAHSVAQVGDYSASLARRYGATALELDEFDVFLSLLRPEPSHVVHPFYDRLVEKDLADIAERAPVATTSFSRVFS